MPPLMLPSRRWSSSSVCCGGVHGPTPTRLRGALHPDMEPAAYGLLVILQREGSMRLTDLAASIGVGKPSVSRQIAMLEQLGLVQKTADPLDGRAQAISLTEDGLRQLSTAQAARKEAFHQLMEDWSLSDLRTLGNLISQLNQTYTKDNSSDTQEEARRMANLLFTHTGVRWNISSW